MAGPSRGAQQSVFTGTGLGTVMRPRHSWVSPQLPAGRGHLQCLGGREAAGAQGQTGCTVGTGPPAACTVLQLLNRRGAQGPEPPHQVPRSALAVGTTHGRPLRGRRRSQPGARGVGGSQGLQEWAGGEAGPETDLRLWERGSPTEPKEQALFRGGGGDWSSHVSQTPLPHCPQASRLSGWP